MRLSFLGFLLLGLVAPLWSAQSRPNILFVLIDDMGWGDFSCFGNTEAKTPNIDRLAAEGLTFSQFYVNSPICSPSRCALVSTVCFHGQVAAANSRRGALLQRTWRELTQCLQVRAGFPVPFPHLHVGAGPH